MPEKSEAKNTNNHHGFPMQHPPGIRVTRRTLATWGSLAVALAIAYGMYLRPTDLGGNLATAIRAATFHSVMPGNVPVYSKISFDPIRHTYGSVIGHDIASVFSWRPRASDTAQAALNEKLTQSHAKGAAMTFAKGFSGMNRDCTIRISAQALDYPESPYVPLMHVFGGRQDTFLLILYHEMAHCHWNGALAFEQRIEKLGVPDMTLPKLMPLAWNINESYGDAYALIIASRTDAGFYQRALYALQAFRSKAPPGTAPHQTTGAIAAIATMIPTLPTGKNPLATSWDVTHRYALSAALTGAKQWLEHQGSTQPEALDKIRKVLDGQDITFDVRTVNNQEYLIVRPTKSD